MPIEITAAGMDEAIMDENAAVDCVMGPGDVSVHHPNVIHGSNANTSARWRRGLTIRYIPTSTRICLDTPEIHPSAFHLRGRDPGGVYRYNPRPVYVEGEWMPFRGCEDWRG